jgi:hypothetical protein
MRAAGGQASVARENAGPVNTLLTGIGEKLAERWAALLVLPGLLWIGAAAVAVVLDGRWNDVRHLVRRIDRLPEKPSTGTVLLVLLAVLLLAAGTGLVARFLGWLVELCWLAPWPRAGRVLRSWRRRRWNSAQEEIRDALRETRWRRDEGSAAEDAPPDITATRARRNQIALREPVGATWMSDRAHALHERVWDVYRVDLVFGWPRVWLTMPEHARGELRAAAAQWKSSALLVGWSLLYLPLALWWWPALLVGGLVLATGWYRGRMAFDAFAHLIEAAVDLYCRDTVKNLGLSRSSPFSLEQGRFLTALARKGA